MAGVVMPVVWEGLAVSASAMLVVLDGIKQNLPEEVTHWAQMSEHTIQKQARVWLEHVDTIFVKDKPSVVIIKAVVWTLLACWVVRLVKEVANGILQEGIMQSIFGVLKQIPGIAYLVEKEKRKVYKMLQDQVYSKRYQGSKVKKFTCLPHKPMSHQQVMDVIKDIESKDEKFDTGDSKLSGAVYFKNSEHADFQSQVYAKFVTANPIHADSYPSVSRMEAEVISMTKSLVAEEGSEVCGSVTSGGSESILCAMKASRDWWLERKGKTLFKKIVHSLPWNIGGTKPEIIIADSAHAAYIKAAEYYHLKLVVIKVNEKTDFRLTAAAVRRKITQNTAIVVASAPTYPHGVVDDVEGIGELAAKYGIACHVDACLGGFVLPFAREAGYKRPGFHFNMHGITSMSIDTHKYGLAHKGTSVVLYRDKHLRGFQFTRITDWSGGLYISPTMAGSRSGAVIAAAWASLLTLGYSGLVDQTRHLLDLIERLEEVIVKNEYLKLMGTPDSTVIAFGSVNQKQLDIFRLNDFLEKKGWHLATLQHPPGLHMCITPAHSILTTKKLANDLDECIKEALACKKGDGGSARIYGMAESLPDRNIIGDVLVAYQNATLDS